MSIERDRDGETERERQRGRKGDTVREGEREKEKENTTYDWQSFVSPLSHWRIVQCTCTCNIRTQYSILGRKRKIIVIKIKA